MLVSIWSINDKEIIIDEFICIKRNRESVKKRTNKGKCTEFFNSKVLVKITNKLKVGKFPTFFLAPSLIFNIFILITQVRFNYKIFPVISKLRNLHFKCLFPKSRQKRKNRGIFEIWDQATTVVSRASLPILTDCITLQHTHVLAVMHSWAGM